MLPEGVEVIVKANPQTLSSKISPRQLRALHARSINHCILGEAYLQLDSTQTIYIFEETTMYQF